MLDVGVAASLLSAIQNSKQTRPAQNTRAIAATLDTPLFVFCVFLCFVFCVVIEFKMVVAFS